MIKELAYKNRSCRRFKEDNRISKETLLELIDIARVSPSSKNLQPLKYIVSVDKDKNEEIFKTLAWAKYLKNWPGPAKGERPSAYIIILLDLEISQNADCDEGIVSQSISLGAVEKKIAACILHSVDRDKLRNTLNIPDKYKISLVIALGEPAEERFIETMKSKEDYKYWRDERGIHHVPKRSLDEIILNII